MYGGGAKSFESRFFGTVCSNIWHSSSSVRRETIYRFLIERMGLCVLSVLYLFEGEMIIINEISETKPLGI